MAEIKKQDCRTYLVFLADGYGCGFGRDRESKQLRFRSVVEVLGRCGFLLATDFGPDSWVQHGYD